MPNLPMTESDLEGEEQHRISGWENVPPQEAFEPVLSGHLLVLHQTPQPVHVFERSDGYRGEGIALPNQLNLFTAGDMSYCSWEEELTFIRLDLNPAVIERVASELELPLGGGSIDLGTHIRLKDERVERLLKWLLEDKRSGGIGGRMYEESLLRMLAVHLLDRYGSVSNRRGTSPGQPSRSQLEGALQYIHEYLDQDISLQELASAAHISASHLTRLFRNATGLPPHQYMIRERIRIAKRKLLGGIPVHEVAASLGFSDQSHFHRHFKRLLGVTPKEFIRNK